jgi:hypothetical protein
MVSSWGITREAYTLLSYGMPSVPVVRPPLEVAVPEPSEAEPPDPPLLAGAQVPVLIDIVVTA